MIEFKSNKEQINVGLLPEYFNKDYSNPFNCPLAQGIKKIMPAHSVNVAPSFIYVQDKKFKILEVWINGEILEGRYDSDTLYNFEGNTFIKIDLEATDKDFEYKPNAFFPSHYFKCLELIHTGKFKSCIVVIEED